MDEAKLIYLVSNYPALYDISSPHYNNQERKQYIWRDIANAVGQSEDKCRHRWKTLRISFTRVLKAKKYALPLEPSKRMRKWRYEDEMSFLIPHIGVKEQQGNTPDYPPHTSDVDDNFSLDANMEDSITEITQQECQIEEPKLRPSSSPRLPTQPPFSVTRNFPSKPDSDHTITDFFLNMAQTVKTFPPLLQAQVKSKVFSAVNSAEQLVYSQDSPWKEYSTSDYNLSSAVFNTHRNVQSTVQASSTSYSTSPMNRDSGFALNCWESPVDSPVSDVPEYKPVILQSPLGHPSGSPESDYSCEVNRGTVTTVKKIHKQ